MDKMGFVAYLKGRRFPDNLIDKHIEIVELYDNFIKDLDPTNSADNTSAESARLYIDKLIKTKQNTLENLTAIARYSYYAENIPVYVSILELIDGEEAIKNLHFKLAEAFSELKRDEIFKGIRIPALGISSKDKSRIACVLMERFENSVDPFKRKKILSSCLRDLPNQMYENDKKKYDEIGDIDKFIEYKRESFIDELEKIKAKRSLFFSQEIDDEVIDYVKNDKEISCGDRHGNILYITKIPYMTKKYLAENDPVLKRYYYCHCPWTRESIKDGERTVSSTFCYCSAGFHKKMWEIIFDRELNVEVLESILKGDLRCRFAVYLPDEIK